MLSGKYYNKQDFSISVWRLKNPGKIVKTFLFLSLSLTASACTNNFNGAFSALSQVSVPGTGSSSNTSTFTLANVLLDTLNPTTELDLIDNGSGTFGQLCTPTGSDTSATGPTVCNCTYTYNSSSPTSSTSSSTSNQSIDTPAIYHENDMIRCNYSSVIPAGVTSFSVAVHVTSSNTYSNTVSMNLSGTVSALDPSNPSTFVQAIRYECRDVEEIPYIFYNAIYDPIQSESVNLTYPLDFYASNLGGAISDYIAAATANQTPLSNEVWNCPAILNASAYLNSTALSTYNSTNHIGLNIYSKSPQNGDDYLIYPPTPGDFDRSTFYLAKQPAGVFTIPVNSYESPYVITSQTVLPNGSSPVAPLGYGAAPISTGTNEETCPDTSAVIPPGFQWVKVWLFRASLPVRTYATSNTLQNSVIGIACNTEDYSDGTAPFYCYQGATDVEGSANKWPGNNEASITQEEIGYIIGTTTLTLADRVIVNTGECVRLQYPGIDSGITCGVSGGLQGPGAGCVGSDYWMYELPSTNDATQDFLHSQSYQTSAGLPYTTDVENKNLDSTGRSDFLFVVTPPTIMVSDMMDTSTGSASAPYQPYRFYTDQDCTSDNPITCNSTNAITLYGLKLHDVGTNGDPPADDPNRPGVFPICALQPI